MRDYILESIFLDTSLWTESIAHGVDKNIASSYLELFADPNWRADFCVDIANGIYKIKPPHTGYRKKDDGGERMFLINKPQDRLLLNIIYKWLMRNEGRMIHPSCMSYQKGIGIGKIVKQISQRITPSQNQNGLVVGRKFDIHKYFDSIDRRYIHDALDKVQAHYGESSVLDLLRNYYDSDLYYDTRRHIMVDQYQGIKQGCAVSSWLANVLLFSIDEELSNRGGLYVRYSDDIIYLGDDYDEVTEILRNRLAQLGLRLNEQKVTDIIAGKYFCFLGFEIHGHNITLSHKWVKYFQQEIDKRTIRDTALIKRVRNIHKSKSKKKETDLRVILEAVERKLARFLFYGNGRYSWATQVLPTVNNSADLQQLTLYCFDAMRAVYTGHTHIGGLGKSLESGIQRGKGRHVKSNKAATAHLFSLANSPLCFTKLISLSAAQKVISNKWLMHTIATDLVDTNFHPLYGQSEGIEQSKQDELIQELESLYADYLNSKPNGNCNGRFYAHSLEELDMELLIKANCRIETFNRLEEYLVKRITFSYLKVSADSWYWQSDTYPQLVLLKKWFQS